MQTDTRLQYLFDELVKALVVLSLPAPVQIEIYGPVHAGTAMAVELDTYYRLQQQRYREAGLLDPAQTALLDALARYLVDRIREPNGFAERVATHPDWHTVRRLSRDCLRALGREHLGIRVQYAYTKEYFEGGGTWTGSFHTEIRLVKKEGY